MRCSSCGFENPPIMKFCGQCGTPLVAGGTPPQTAAPRPTPAPPKEAVAERRHLTVMFCDLADAAALSERLDPEELREIVRDYQSVSQNVVQRFRGHVAQYLGDGIMVYFGYPQAQDDDARLAVRAGLGILNAVAQLSERLERERGLTLAVRVGIHTGDVVTGAVGTAQRREQLALGQAPNIAARLQGLARPDEVVLSPATRQLTRGFFSVESLGPMAMKGVAEPMEVFRVVAESGVTSRFQLAVKLGLTPLAGRQEELARLRSAFSRAEGGEGQVVLISGDVGFGKSRLLHALEEELAEEPHTWWNCWFSPDLRHSALAPVAALAGRIVGLAPRASDAERLRQLEAVLTSSFDLPLAESVPLFAGFLSLETGNRYPVPDLNPGRQTERVLELITSLLRTSSEQCPVVLAAEDVHWCDPSSLAFLERLVGLAEKTRLLVVLTCRPGFVGPWQPPLHQSQLDLERLDGADVAEMVQSLAGAPLPREVLLRIEDKAGGVPLFVEELTRMVLESGQLRETRRGWVLTGERLAMEIPSTLQDLLMARIDGQQDAKETAQLAAVLGREFTVEQLTAVSELDEPELSRRLDQLVEAGLLSPLGEGSGFVFKSTLIQETAYRSLLKSRRQHYHRKISRLFAQAPEITGDRPEVVAHHLTEGGSWKDALKYWLQAGRRALSRSANLEAIAHLEKGLQLLTKVTISVLRDRQEVEFQSALGVAWAAARGFASEEAEQAWTRTRELCLVLGKPPQLALALHGLWMVRFARAELAQALELGRQTLELAEAGQDNGQILMGHNSIGATLFYQGDFPSALEHFETGLALETAEDGDTALFVADHRVSALSLSALALWIRGFPTKAALRSHDAIVRARELAHPFSMCYAFSFGAWLHTYRRDAETARALIDELGQLAEKQGFLPADWGDFFLGPLLGEREPADTNSGYSASRNTHTGFGLNLGMTSTCCLLAERYLAQEQLERAEGALHWGFDALSSSEEKCWEGELYRLSGELVLAGDVGGVEAAREEAEGRFRKALEITSGQGARSLELRSATSLARLLWDLSRRNQARDLLTQVYGSFTEGFEVADLQEARSLLETFR